MKKNILWISTGGTFACKKTEKGLSPKADEKFAEKIICTFTRDNDIKITPALLINKDSTEMRISDIKKMAECVKENINSYTGIIITHGTDTMAYTSAMLSVMLKNSPIPIIITGSQLPFTAENTDAEKNFSDSIAAALCDELKTVCVVFDGKIFHGMDCYKASSTSFDAFAAYDEILGKAEGGRVEIKDKKRINSGEFIYNEDICEDIALIKLTPSFDENILDYYIKNGARGFVIEGYGTGGIPERVIERLRKAGENGILSMVITQCKSGGTALAVYEVGNNVSKAGIIDGGRLGAEGAVARMAEICGTEFK